MPPTCPQKFTGETVSGVKRLFVEAVGSLSHGISRWDLSIYPGRAAKFTPVAMIPGLIDRTLCAGLTQDGCSIGIVILSGLDLTARSEPTRFNPVKAIHNTLVGLIRIDEQGSYLTRRPALSGDLVFTSHLDIVVWNVRLCLAVAWRCFEPTHDARSSTFSILQIANSLSRRDVDLWWHRRFGPRIQLVRLIVRLLGPPQPSHNQATT
jgi:hypothetical protein